MIAGSACVESVEDRGGEEFGVGEDVGDENRVLSAYFSMLGKRTDGKKCFVQYEILAQHQVGELVFVRVPDHRVNAGKGGDFFGCALRVASGNDDFCQRILPLDAPYSGTSVLVSGICDGAGVKNYQAGLVCGGGGEAASLELSLDGSAVRLCSAASEVLYAVRRHTIMVAQFEGHLPTPHRTHLGAIRVHARMCAVIGRDETVRR